jgi:hypothetical protein
MQNFSLCRWRLAGTICIVRHTRASAMPARTGETLDGPFLAAGDPLPLTTLSSAAAARGVCTHKWLGGHSGSGHAETTTNSQRSQPVRHAPSLRRRFSRAGGEIPRPHRLRRPAGPGRAPKRLIIARFIAIERRRPRRLRPSVALRLQRPARRRHLDGRKSAAAGLSAAL